MIFLQMTLARDIKGYRNMLWQICCMMSVHLMMWRMQVGLPPTSLCFLFIWGHVSFYLRTFCSADFLQSKTTLAKGEAVSMGSSAHQLMFAHKSEA